MKPSVELLPAAEAAFDRWEGSLDARQLHMLLEIFKRQPLAASGGGRTRADTQAEPKSQIYAWVGSSFSLALRAKAKSNVCEANFNSQEVAANVAGPLEAPLSAWHETPRALSLLVVLLTRHARVIQARAEPFLFPPPGGR